LEKLINLKVLNIDGIKYSIKENIDPFCKLIAKSPQSLKVIERTYTRRVDLGDGLPNKLASKKIFDSAPMVERESLYENIDHSPKRQLRCSYKRSEIMKSDKKQKQRFKRIEEQETQVDLIEEFVNLLRKL